jgi:hypothetical protein
MSIHLDGAAIVTGALALGVSLLAWRTAIDANRTARFDRRFEAYTDVATFVEAWQKRGRPDMDQLPTLVRAWDKSHFLFERSVALYLRSLWLDALDVDRCYRIIAGEEQGNRQEAIKNAHSLTLKHCDAEKLRELFSPHLKLRAGNAGLDKGRQILAEQARRAVGWLGFVARRAS